MLTIKAYDNIYVDKKLVIRYSGINCVSLAKTKNMQNVHQKFEKHIDMIFTKNV